jgi:hypothetical protein
VSTGTCSCTKSGCDPDYKPGKSNARRWVYFATTRTIVRMAALIGSGSEVLLL